ncbi:unnamed protein product [Symbiodinium sp. CCMP2592]|nr:unnamed protein product [Symbiodinium sp. CCMP2592]
MSKSTTCCHVARLCYFQGPMLGQVEFSPFETLPICISLVSWEKEGTASVRNSACHSMRASQILAERRRQVLVQVEVAMACSCSSLLLGLLALLLASGLSGLSWCWSYVKDLEKRVASVSDVQDLQSRLAALEARCAKQHHATSATPEKREPLAWPSSSARHLSQTQENQDHDAFDDGSRYLYTGNQTYKYDKWTTYKGEMWNAILMSCPIEHLPGITLEEREAQQLICAATVGQKDEAFAALKKHPHLADLALAAAAFGDVAFIGIDKEGEIDYAFQHKAKVRARAESNLGSRLEIVRHLFTQGASGNSTFIDQGIDFARKNKVDIDKRMIRLVSWGSLRRWLLVKPLILSNSFDNATLADGFEIFLNWRKMADPAAVSAPSLASYALVYPKAAMQYSTENPQVLEEKSSEDKTMLMEASSGNFAGDPDRFQCLLAEAKLRQTPIDQMSATGENAAMLAAEAGFLDHSKELEDLKAEKELEDTSGVYHFQYMLLLVVGLHLAFAVVGLQCPDPLRSGAWPPAST